ncbi:hypothetical protein [Desulfosporosinus sp. OT]|uniref:hypothetical protein n=1 Tax=Desulfosporosinus sp. OT TaxID=913865 RepID=UPI000223A8D6|nr:hypothetical protein [Desulfosporosinus sp. OT]EGW39790.1 hypothetical protein DOT_2006 [Desulfosporosinus sp. OT]
MTSNNSNYREVLDKATGVLINLPIGFIENRQDYSIRSKKQDKAYRNRMQAQSMSERASENFYWSNLVNISTLMAEKKLSTSALGLLMILGCHLNNGSDVLCTQKKTPYTTAELIALTDVPKRTFVRAMDELKACGLVIVEGTARKPVYTVNSTYHFVGRNPQANKSARTYVNGVKALQEAKLSLSEIGFVYAVLPLLAYERCVLVKDRDNSEDNTDNLHDIASLCEYLEVTRMNLSKYMKMTFEFDFNEGRYRVPVFGKFSAGGSKSNAYIVNPVIVRRAVMNINYSNYADLEGMFKTYRQKV